MVAGGAGNAVFAGDAGMVRFAMSVVRVIAHTAENAVGTPASAQRTTDALYRGGVKAKRFLRINDLYKMSERTNPSLLSLLVS